MAQLVVRNLEDVVKDGLRRRAARHRRSLEEEVREILRNAAREEHEPAPLGSRIAAHFAVVGFERDIHEHRGTMTRAANLE